MGQWLRDLRYAVRTLRRAPGFTAAAVGTLALALGVNAGIFSVVDAVLLRPLPYHEPDRLVHIAASAPGSDFPGEFGVSAEFLVHYAEHATQLQDVAGFNSGTGTLRAGDRVERLRQAISSVSLFRTLGATPVLGRLPVEGDGGQVALISHGLWTSWFAADPGVVGTTHEFAMGPREVIGVMPPDLHFPGADVAAWIPVEIVGEDIVPGRFGEYQLVGRLSEGADEGSLSAELERLAAQLPELYGGTANYARVMEQHRPVVRPLQDLVVGEASGALWVLMGAVGLVLLIACANVAGLFAVRAEGRGREQAVRRAIGADRLALMRSELSVAIVISALAGGAALMLAWVTLPLFLAAAPEGLPRAAEVHLSGGTLLFMLAASVFVALFCGLFPSIRSSNPDLGRLRDGGRGTTRRTHRGRDLLVVGQTALALTLLVGSGLLLRSFQELRSVDPGYDTRGILTFQFAPDQAQLNDGLSWALFHRDFLDRLRALPGVEAAGIVENVPLDEGLRSVGFATESVATDDPGSGPRGSATFAGGDYFQAMGIDVVQGRAFNDSDIVTPGNVVVSRAAAELLWPGENPVGRQLRNEAVMEWHTVVGVVEDILQYDLRDAGEPLVYYPLVGPGDRSWALSSPGYVVRTPRADAITPEIRALVREVAPEAPMYRVYTMETLLDRSMVNLSFTMLTLGVAAALALLLGAIGLYGVLSYVVAERTPEIGVRMALGAGTARVRRMVVAQGIRVVGVGIVIGLGLALMASRALSGLLFGVAPFDPWTFAATALAMAAVGVLASWIPAHRASRVDPLESMRGV